ncbi:mCG1027486, isoform CRA_b, partial [Mus musculus]
SWILNHRTVIRGTAGRAKEDRTVSCVCGHKQKPGEDVGKTQEENLGLPSYQGQGTNEPLQRFVERGSCPLPTTYSRQLFSYSSRVAFLNLKWEIPYLEPHQSFL